MIHILLNSLKLTCFIQTIQGKKQRKSDLTLKIEKITPNNFTPYMNENRLNTLTQSKNLICDWTDKKKCLTLFRMLKLYVRQVMVIVKIQEVISFKLRRWLEKHATFNTQETPIAEKGFKKDLPKNTYCFLRKNDENC